MGNNSLGGLSFRPFRFLSAVAYIYSYNGDSIECRSNNPWEDSTIPLAWIRDTCIRYIYIYIFLGLDWS